LSLSNLILYSAVVAAGVCLALQQILNANLRIQLDSPWWAGFGSYFVGMLVMLVIASSTGMPKLQDGLSTHTSWLSWTGGLFGAIFIGTAILTIPRLGAATVLALIVVGQMLGSLTFDHFGLFGMPQHPASFVRLAGAGLLVAGVILVRL
jgi:transporter family-2 protein